jgi:malate dehydrogenase
MMNEPIRVAISGAAGRISYALMFRIAAGGMFGPEQPVALSLLDIPETMPLLEATMMDLHDGAFPLLNSVTGTSDPFEAFDRADWVILIGSASLRPGMRRSDLLLLNAPLFQQKGRAINEASPSARVLVVANPCNTNCMIAKSVARDVPPEHWFAMTRLDQNRARAFLADKAGVSVDQVTRVTVWGNHSDQVYPDFHNSFIGDRPANEVIRDHDWVRNVFEPAVQHRGVELLEKLGASPAGSAAQAIIATIRSITTPTPVMHRFSAAVVSDGSYGVPGDLIFGFPLRSEDGQTWSIVQNLYLDSHALDRIAANVAELEYEASAVTNFLGHVR